MSIRKATQADAGEDMADLLSLPGMNAERVEMLVTRLHVRNRADLKRALFAGRVSGLDGFTREVRSRLQAALEAERDGS